MFLLYVPHIGGEFSAIKDHGIRLGEMLIYKVFKDYDQLHRILAKSIHTIYRQSEVCAVFNLNIRPCCKLIRLLNDQADTAINIYWRSVESFKLVALPLYM